MLTLNIVICSQFLNLIGNQRSLISLLTKTVRKRKRVVLHFVRYFEVGENSE